MIELYKVFGLLFGFLLLCVIGVNIILYLFNKKPKEFIRDQLKQNKINQLIKELEQEKAKMFFYRPEPKLNEYFNFIINDLKDNKWFNYYLYLDKAKSNWYKQNKQNILNNDDDIYLYYQLEEMLKNFKKSNL